MKDGDETTIVKLCKPKEKWSMGNVGGVFLPYTTCEELERMDDDERERELDYRIKRYNRDKMEASVDLGKKLVTLTPIGTWKNVARWEFGAQQASGHAPTLDSIEDRCDMMDTWKECAMDLHGYTDFS